MAKGTVNRVILIGNVGADPDVKDTKSGKVVNIRLATVDRQKDQSGQYQDVTEWHRITVFGKTAEAMAQYCRKGSKAYVEGKLSIRKYIDKKDGVEKTAIEVIANDVQLLNRVETVKDSGKINHGGSENFDDEIPF